MARKRQWYMLVGVYHLDMTFKRYQWMPITSIPQEQWSTPRQCFMVCDDYPPVFAASPPATPAR